MGSCPYRSGTLQVMTPPGNWSLFRGGGGGHKAPDAKPKNKMHSFDALMSQPQGCPVSVRMQRDTTARQQTQPLFNFFKNALGLYTKQEKDGVSANPRANPSARYIPHLLDYTFPLRLVMTTSRACYAMRCVAGSQSDEAPQELIQTHLMQVTTWESFGPVHRSRWPLGHVS